MWAIEVHGHASSRGDWRTFFRYDMRDPALAALWRLRRRWPRTAFRLENIGDYQPAELGDDWMPVQ